MAEGLNSYSLSGFNSEFMTAEQKIRAKEKEVHNRFVKHKTGGSTPYQSVGYFSEDAMLADWFAWLREVHPKLRYYVFHIANEGSSSSEESRMAGAKNLTKGVLTGVFDIHETWTPEQNWLEAKLLNGVWSEAQLRLKEKWELRGRKIFEARNFDQFKYWVESVILKLY